jgi:hypothetical protein
MGGFPNLFWNLFLHHVLVKLPGYKQCGRKVLGMIFLKIKDT